ncbi:MAG: putative surface protein with fasciclin (FAS1) repeats [Ilumatobacter sp.]|jgi:transforming growth factor-beta-induced protein
MMAAVASFALLAAGCGSDSNNNSAPVNDAFAAISKADLAAVLADREVLTSILTYHVIGGQSYDAAGLGELGSSTTVNGAELTLGADGTAVNGVDVLCSNVTTANATVHNIDGVLMPT